MKPLAHRLGPIGLALLALLPVALGGSCATAVTSGDGGAGGSSPSGAGGSTPDAGKDAPHEGCTKDVDCAIAGDACNIGACVNGTCVKAPGNENGKCDDGLFCTENDFCMNGACVAGDPKYCVSTAPCTVGVCDETTNTCVPMPGSDGDPCDSMDACAQLGTCFNGQCEKGPPLDCSVLNDVCAVGTCLPGQGCMAVPKNDGQPCNDGKYCSINDHCQSAVCVGDPNPCAPPNNSCQVGVCNELLKACSITVAPNGIACDDGSNCTAGEKCSNGLCVGGQPANNGAVCDDKNGCTTGTTCVNGTCGNAASQVTTCVAGDSCCPANCSFATDADCLYWASGVLENVPPATLVGWQTCYTDTYAVSMDDPKVDQILQQCNKGRLLLACRKVGAVNYQLAAMGFRADVLFDCGMSGTCTHVANGVGWYWSKQWSWGFADAVDVVARNQCDTNAGPLRLCWHTLNNVGGYRCGSNAGLNSDPTWERDVLQAN